MSGSAFNQCLNLNTLEVDKANPNFCSINNFIFNKEMTTLVRTPINFKCEMIPNRENIQNLGEFMMSGSTIEEFIGWPNISTIGIYAFHVTRFLRNIDISMTNVTSIPSHCFEVCSQLNRIHLPGNLSSISNNAFIYLHVIRTIYIPLKVDSIEDNSFAYNNCLKMIVYFGTTDFQYRNLSIYCPLLSVARVTTTYPSSKFGFLDVQKNAYKNGIIEDICISLQIHYSHNFSFSFFLSILNSLII